MKRLLNGLMFSHFEVITQITSHWRVLRAPVITKSHSLAASARVHNWEDEIALVSIIVTPIKPVDVASMLCPKLLTSTLPAFNVPPSTWWFDKAKTPVHLCRKAVQDRVACFLSQTTKIKYRKVALILLFLGPPNRLMMALFSFFFFSLRYQGKSLHVCSRATATDVNSRRA